MRRTCLPLALVTACLSAAGGCGPVTVSGSIGLPTGLALPPSFSCDMILVEATQSFLDASDTLAVATITGSPEAGGCHYELTLPTFTRVIVGGRVNIEYAECPDLPRLVLLRGDALFTTFVPITLNLTPELVHPCP